MEINVNVTKTHLFMVHVFVCTRMLLVCQSINHSFFNHGKIFSNTKLQTSAK